MDKIAAMPDKIELVTSHVIDEIRGGENMDAIAVRHVGSGKTRVIPVEGLFIYVGMQPLSGFLPAELDMDAELTPKCVPICQACSRLVMCVRNCVVR